VAGRAEESGDKDGERTGAEPGGAQRLSHP